MNVNDLLLDGFGRLPDLVRSAVEDLDPDDLRWAPGPAANPIGWLVWHLTRVQDSHLAEVVGSRQVYLEGAWSKRFGLEPDPEETGYDHTIEQVHTVHPESADALVEYFDAVHEKTVTFLRGLTPADLDRIVDERWDPPVTLGVRLISVLDDDLEHVGQAAYVRGLLGR
ncbi:mycothiol transferase [Virgisporangium aurantiacum]|uniref:DinB-like domain-containing protein n=1 Tax=Virgisporangium aurantiacum TaxID=175570 RepID=A0A8J3Z427_9ACTN|nr:DinB family protein [Virgisporangium aurantiacum]GIJ55923.1 hypothetical protein Vau01_034390 [Virgisporangium aurantiacum]